MSDKSFIATWLLAWLLGVFGVDRFYLGKIGTGIAKLVTFGGLGVWALIDLILTLTGNATDALGRKVRGRGKESMIAWIVTGVIIGLGLIVNIVNGSNAASTVGSAPAEQVVSEETTTASEEEPQETAPAIEPGTSLEAPLPAGTPVQVDSWAGKYTVSFGAVNWDATAAVVNENPFNMEPEAGEKYITVTVTMTNDDAEEWNPYGTLFWGDIKLVSNGRGFSEGAIVVIPNGLSEQGDLYPGGQATGDIAFLVPADVVDGVWDIDGTFVAAQ
jgi:TM2 domain-containing membrane protein YozV